MRKSSAWRSSIICSSETTTNFSPWAIVWKMVGLSRYLGTILVRLIITLRSYFRTDPGSRALFRGRSTNIFKYSRIKSHFSPNYIFLMTNLIDKRKLIISFGILRGQIQKFKWSERWNSWGELINGRIRQISVWFYGQICFKQSGYSVYFLEISTLFI